MDDLVQFLISHATENQLVFSSGTMAELSDLRNSLVRAGLIAFIYTKGNPLELVQFNETSEPAILITFPICCDDCIFRTVKPTVLVSSASMLTVKEHEYMLRTLNSTIGYDWNIEKNENIVTVEAKDVIQ